MDTAHDDAAADARRPRQVEAWSSIMRLMLCARSEIARRLGHRAAASSSAVFFSMIIAAMTIALSGPRRSWPSMAVKSSFMRSVSVRSRNSSASCNCWR